MNILNSVRPQFYVREFASQQFFVDKQRSTEIYNQQRMQDILKEQLTRIIRYAYPGFLSMLFVSFVATEDLKTLLDTIGVTLSAACAIVVGATLYTGYRLVLGEIIIFPAVNAVHTFIRSHLINF